MFTIYVFAGVDYLLRAALDWNSSGEAEGKYTDGFIVWTTLKPSVYLA